MNISSHYDLKYFIPWTRSKIYKIFLISIIPVLLFLYLDLKWLAIPWVPIALLGTATAFISGFKNTQTYSRSWEARQNFGAIVGGSRMFGIMVKAFIRSANKEHEAALHQEIIYRHFAWLTALRFQLREVKSWENVKSKRYNLEFQKHYKVPEWESNLGDELETLLSKEERSYILSTKSKATQILSLQSAALRKLHEDGLINDLNYVALENQLSELSGFQGKCERVKNFPYPRQFSSVNLFFTNLFCFMLPLGFLGEFTKLTSQFGPNVIWLTVPFSMLVGWVFLVLEQIGESTENPFEGNANDIPITQMSRNIEIDMREMLGEKELPPPVLPQNNILM